MLVTGTKDGYGSAAGQPAGRRDYAEPTRTTPALAWVWALLAGHMAAIALGPAYCTLLTAAAWMAALIGRRRRGSLLALAVALGSVLPGMAVVQGSSARLSGMHMDGLVVGRIIRAEPVSAPRMVELAVEETRAFDTTSGQVRPRRIRLQLHAPDDPLRAARSGEVWELPVRLRAPRGLANPGGGDPERNLFRAGVDAQGYIRGEGAQRLRPAPARPSLSGLRARASAAVATAAPGTGGRHLRALLVGDRSALTAGDWALLATTGTTHLLVVSGLHVGMVAAVVLGLLALTGLRARAPGAAILLVLAAAGGYALLTGFELPARRAVLMLAVGAVLLVANRHGNPLSALLCAAVVILLLDPLAPLAAGFWLSFLAVAALLLVVSGRSLMGLSAWRGTLLAQLAVTTLLALPLAMAFGRMPLLAPLVNLFAIPLVAMVLLPLGLGLGLATALAIPGAQTGLGVLGEALTLALAGLAALPEYAVPLQVAGGVLVPLAVLAAILVWVPWPWPLRALALLVLVALLIPKTGAPPQGGLRVHVLDVGQGHAAVVRTHRHTLLYDTGPAFGADSDAGSRVVIPVLAALGIRRLDGIMVSHAHFDHMGGLPSVHAAFPDTEIFSPVTLPSAFPATVPCHAGQGWEWDGVRFDVLLPQPGVAGEPRWYNRDSCVLRIRSAGASVLLPGDIDVFAERRLAADVGRKDLVVAPHHGSHTSSGRVLVRLTEPRFVAVPAGCPSPFGHPHAVVVERWEAAGAVVLGTGPGGMLTWDSSRPTELQALRAQRQRYWHWRPETGCGER
ncbi:MAG: DNA internalization-related competence protein ComEC/Rec2 [Gammaproteobacteria bacterium]|nr:DNA internalization-related competence protein ComEC/Rec2 [Gammaproteobacteria bacterium]